MPYELQESEQIKAANALAAEEAEKKGMGMGMGMGMGASKGIEMLNKEKVKVLKREEGEMERDKIVLECRMRFLPC